VGTYLTGRGVSLREPDALQRKILSMTRLVERVLQPELSQGHLGSSTLCVEIPPAGATSTRSVSFKPVVAGKLRKHVGVEIHPLFDVGRRHSIDVSGTWYKPSTQAAQYPPREA